MKVQTYKKHDTQCVYNVTLRPVCATVVAVEKHLVLHNLCVCVCVCVCVYVCVFVALSIQRAMRMRHIVIFGLPRSAKCFHVMSQTARFWKKCY